MESEKEIEQMTRQVLVFKDSPIWDNGGPMTHALMTAVLRLHRLDKLFERDECLK